MAIKSLLFACLLALTGCGTAAGPGQALAATSQAAASAPAQGVEPRTSHDTTRLAIPLAQGRLRSRDIGLVVNIRDPYSVEVGRYYAKRRGLRPEQVLQVDLPVQGILTPLEFESLRKSVDDHFGTGVQALALAWTAPWAVSCNSITGALSLGFDAALCSNSCAPSRQSPYLNSASGRPFADHGLRPSMLIAAGSVAQAKALIDRGVRADGALLSLIRGPVEADFVITDDVRRNVRARLYPPVGTLARAGVVVRVTDAKAWAGPYKVLLVHIGAAQVKGLQGIDWAPGGLGDHLTSSGGDLEPGNRQTTVLDWIDGGATASHGAVSEPCNHVQKFPNPQLLLLHYLQGSTVIEAYWKSVAWPQQSLFVGEPLAAPFSRR
jgi:uncharacterized protein (TIGR03790 family)